MGIRPKRDTKCASQTEIRQLEVQVLVNQQILGLQVAVEDTVGMAVAHTLAQLHHELLDELVVHGQVLPRQPRALWQRLATAALADGQRLHVLLEVEVEELHDEVQLVAVGVDDVEETHDVGVVHFLEQRDLADGGRGHAFVFGLEADLLERDDAVVLCGQVARLVDNAVCA